MTQAPPAFWIITLFLMGITIGSFLTAVIYRLPRNMTLLEPKRSMCPNCKKSLSAIDLVPVFSFLFLGQKCRQCQTPISWRYFGVEMMTGLSFVALYLRFPHFPHDAPILIALLLFTAVLIPIFFIDLATFTIPVSLNLLATVIPFGLDAWGIATHTEGYELIWGWMPRSILGAIVGTLIFGGVRIAGWIYKGVEAMGLGDVFLARGMGAMLMVALLPDFSSFWYFPAWVILSCFAGIIVGPALIFVRRQKEAKNPQKTLDRYGNSPVDGELADAQPDGPPSSLGQQLLDVALVLIGYDAYEWLRITFDQKYRADWQAEFALMPEDDFVPAATAIPFGPFLVVGFLATIFGGDAMIHAYLAYAHLDQGSQPALPASS